MKIVEHEGEFSECCDYFSAGDSDVFYNGCLVAAYICGTDELHVSGRWLNEASNLNGNIRPNFRAGPHDVVI